ncbi:MAG TPA: hypothetical protein VFV87_12605, partial [Pirellulaceae bacterium]|nr:hypothetical protein [Pirellulaceae bacterium]
FDATARGPAAPLLDASLWAPAVDSAIELELTSADWLTRPAGPPPPLRDGRQVRIAVQSFLL